MRFNVKSKDNYDKEFGSNEVYQFIFGEEYLDFIFMSRKNAMVDEDQFEDDINA